MRLWIPVMDQRIESMHFSASIFWVILPDTSSRDWTHINSCE
jgi:hypothetical protein